MKRWLLPSLESINAMKDARILHVDGDAFFVGCEVARRPDLRGTAVVTGHERGIVSAASYEAKALGITRAMPIHEVRRTYPQVTVLYSDFELYAMVSKRMYAIVRRHVPLVEEYGVDECFADLSHIADPVAACRRIKEDLQRELNMTFSLGIGPTKVLAKLGSKYRKPDGFFVVSEAVREECLRNTPAKYVWGIGPRTAQRLAGMGVHSAYDFVSLPESLITREFTRPVHDLWQELRSISVLEVAHGNAEAQKSIQRTRSFPATTDPRFLFAELSRHTETGCRRLRKLGFVATHARIFIKTQAFRYYATDFALPQATNAPAVVLPTLRTEFLSVFTKDVLYRSTGITFYGLRTPASVQDDLFGSGEMRQKHTLLMRALDRLEHKYGEHVLYLGTSADAIVRDKVRPFVSKMHEDALIRTHEGWKRLPIPFLGTVS